MGVILLWAGLAAGYLAIGTAFAAAVNTWDRKYNRSYPVEMAFLGMLVLTWPPLLVGTVLALAVLGLGWIASGGWR